jgi:hypothetical protein
MDLIKEAFAKAKQDILNLQSQLDFLKNELSEIKRTLELIAQRDTNQADTFPLEIPSNASKTPLNLSLRQTDQETDTFKLPLYGLKSPNKAFSIGNDGVPTDRQTDRQTDTFSQHNSSLEIRKELKEDKISHLERVSEVLTSLDSIKKDLRHKFKRLTSQEMAVFSKIYELEEQGFLVDYSLISQKFSLSESSIRDYIQKIIKKGIPIIKTKENNKKVILTIDPNLKKITSLQTLSALREL